MAQVALSVCSPSAKSGISAIAWPLKVRFQDD
jgi:hypothetical protein